MAKIRRLNGNLELVYNGLISGWIVCPRCENCVPNLLVDGQTIDTTLTVINRDDVPGGVGFNLRFARIEHRRTVVLIRCTTHAESGFLEVSCGDNWSMPAIANIESSNWPIFSGWVLSLTNNEPICALRIESLDSIRLFSNHPRPDIEEIYGRKGVIGFHVDLGAYLGYALPERCRIELISDGILIGESRVLGSPLGPQDEGCLPRGRGQTVGRKDLERLQTRFRKVEPGVVQSDWRSALSQLGFDDHSTEIDQWASYLSHHGLTHNQIAVWLAARICGSLGVDGICPLPKAFETELRVDYPMRGSTLAKWQAGLHEDAVFDEFEAGQPKDSFKRSHAKVAVAGLVNHRSGLGQHARMSQRIVQNLGMHACTAGFFPSFGGWNPRLESSLESLSALRDHSVLLHLPLDTIVASLTAQPALLATNRLIGFFYWEMEWVPKPFHIGLDVMDEIWVATDFVAEAFRRVTSTPVHVAGNAVDVSQVELVARSQLGISEDAFVVHFSFDANSTVARKNPSGAIDAFLRATDGDPSAVLLMKVRNFEQVRVSARHGDIHARAFLEKVSLDHRIRLITRELDYSKSLGLIQLSDCYLSLHRSEGYGYGMAEAMALGVPVIATGYSGNLDFMSNDSALLVPYDKRPILPGEYFHWDSKMHWAEPDVKVAASHLGKLISLGRRPLAESRLVLNTQDVGKLRERYRVLLLGA